MRHLFTPPLFKIIAIAFTVTACSSGGGGSQPTAPDPAATPNQAPTSPPYQTFAQQPEDPDNLEQQSNSFEDGEYGGMGFLAMINASTAYARGATGAGVKVGVIDSGVLTDHLEFDNGLGGGKADIAGSDYSLFGEERSNEAIIHGTLVSGVIAANRDGNPVVPGVSFNMHGVAFDADIVAYEIPLGDGSGPYEPLDTGEVTFADDDFWAERFTSMANQVPIVNMSFGFAGAVTEFNAAEINTAFPRTLNALRQANKVLADRSIFIVSAGNANGQTDDMGNPVDASSPEILAGLPYLFPELKDHMLAVVAVDITGEIAFYSNRCGVAADFCLAAPGGGDNGENDFVWGPIPTPAGENPDLFYYGGAAGTSFAAPMVSGALALLKSMFPSVGHHELVDRLLQTANKSGIYADQSIYGQGLLDLATATAPVGATNMTTGSSVNGPSFAAAGSGLTTTWGALGDSFSTALGSRSIAVFDEMGFPFYLPARSLLHNHSNTLPASQLHHGSIDYADGTTINAGMSFDTGYFDARFHPQLADHFSQDYLAMHYRDQATGRESFVGWNSNPGWFFGLYGEHALQPAGTENDSAFAAPWLRFARNGWSSGGGLPVGNGKLRFGFFRGSAGRDTNQPVTDTGAQGTMMEYARKFARGGFSLQTGLVREDNSFLGISPTGALGAVANVDTWFVGINSHLRLAGKWHGLVAAYSGMTNPMLDTRLLKVTDTVLSTAFALGVNGRSLWQKGDSLGLFITQPLRIEQGDATLRIPVDRTLHKQVVYENLHLPLEPSEREHRLELNYGFNLGPVRASASLHYVQHPGHSDRIEDAVNTTVSMSMQF